MQLLLMGKHHMISVRVSLMWGCWLSPCCRVKHVSRGTTGGIEGSPLGSSVYILLHCRADSNSRTVFNCVRAPVLVPSRTIQKVIPIEVSGDVHKILHIQAPNASWMLPHTRCWRLISWHLSCPHQTQMSSPCPFWFRGCFLCWPLGLNESSSCLFCVGNGC